jgi:HK97 family phage major capsid protein
MLKKLKLPTMRYAELEDFVLLDRAADAPADAPAVYRMTVSSEAPVARYFGTEILDHGQQAVDLARAKQGLSVRDTHFGDVVGIATNPGLTDQRKLAFDVVFSRNDRAQEIERDVNAVPRIRRFVSIRYNPMRAKLEQAAKDGNPDVYRVMRWAPIHVAFEPDPADFTVGPGRSQTEGDALEVEIEGGQTAEEVRSVDPCAKCGIQHQGACAAAPAAAGDRSAGGSAPAPAAAATATLEVGIDHSKRAAAVLRLASEHKVADRAADWIEKGLSVEQVSSEILKLQRTTPISQPASELLVAASEKDAKRYSYARALRAWAANAADEGEFDGVEAEFHQELVRKVPGGYQYRGGLLMPMRLLETGAGEARARQRALDTKTAAAGAEAVFDQPSSEVIELLRNQSVAARAGVRVLTGLTAPIPFLKVTGASTAYWVGENPAANVASSNPATGLTHLMPKTLQANVPYSRQFLMLSSIDVENWVRDDLAQVHALAIDRAVFHGLGAGGEPVGIYLADAVQIKAYSGTPTYTNVVDVTGLLGDKNALRGRPCWVTTPLLAAAMKRTPVISGAAAGFVWDGPIDEGTVAGYRALSSAQISKVLGGGADEHGIIFGNFDDEVVGMWGAMEAIVDPYALKKTGMIEITTFQMADTMLRHGESFVKGTGAKPS